ncbi:VirK/YbjX family protein [Acerihabitans sp. KWT182]|uniref:VirK/YbjX family protein n=1 Tax=Acerihabitans sp. KWT182 TaxID=3157919 RepID=A0AAU7Q6V1_9GAMM
MEHTYLRTASGKKAPSLALLIELLEGQCIPDNLWRKRFFRIKFAARSLLHPMLSLRILGNIATNPVWREAFSVQTKLPDKIHKPYLYSGLSVRQRASALIDHYHYIENIENVPLRKAFLSAQGRVIASFTGKEGELFTVKMGSIGKSEREGETNMFLYMGETRLAALTFCLVRRPEGAVAIVGGFQGANRSTPHELIKQATKSCYGLFPKRLLLESLLRIVKRLDIKRILAVSDAGHIFNSLRYRRRKKDVFMASYDEFWDSINAIPYSTSLYDIPLTIPRKEMDDLPSKKRSEYRKRYALLDELSNSMSSLLA